MRARTRFARKIATTAVGLLGVVGTMVAGAAPASAVTPAQVISALQKAYQVYQMFTDDKLTLEQATTRIVEAINTAKTEIQHHTDLIASAEVRACARSAVTDLRDIRRFSRDTREAFARDTTLCADKAEALIASTEGAGLDQSGFALNVVGPIALLARASAGLDTELLAQTLVLGNDNLLVRLHPRCQATRLQRDAESGGQVEWQLKCVAYHGQTGFDSVIAKRGSAPRIDFTAARNEAMRGTSFPIGVDALASLRS